MTVNGWLLLVVLICLSFSAFFSGMEAGVFALSRLRVRQQMQTGNSSARLLHGFLEHPEDFLWTILVGNALGNFVAVVLMVCLLNAWLGERDLPLLAALLVVVFLLYALGDLLPKMLFRQFPNRLCLRAARPFRLLHLALSPLVALVAWLAGRLLRWTGGRRFTGRLFGSREELRLVMQESAQALTSEERTMVNRVLDLQNLTVGAIAVPLHKAVTVTTQTPMAEVCRLCREGGLTRLPVRERPGGRIAGIVNLKTSLYAAKVDPQQTAGDFLQPGLFLDESARLEFALRRLQRTGQRMAIVLGRDQHEVAIITLEDILRFIFGEVRL
jgi:CBS domain containing-hemolysin-like protein